MAWTPPLTWDTGRLVTAADLNTQIRDNLLYLKTPPVKRVVPPPVTITDTGAYVPITETQNIVTQGIARVLLIAVGSYANAGTGNKSFGVGLEVNGGSAFNLTGGQTRTDEALTPLTVAWLTDALPGAFHTFRLMAFVAGGGSVKFTFTQFMLIEV